MAQDTWNVTKQMMSCVGSGSFGGGAANPGDSHIPIGRWDPGTGLSWVSRAALYAPVSFSGMTSINFARLYLHQHTASGWHAKGSGSNKGILVYRKTADWSESSHGSSTGVDEVWGGNGSGVIVSGYTGAGDPISHFEPDAADDTLDFVDITEIVRDWFNGSPNYGVMIRSSSGSETTDFTDALEFYSRHVSGSRPYILIDYDTNTTPNAPTNTEPDNEAVVSSNTLQWRHSDPDSGDQATSASVLLYTATGSQHINSNSGSQLVDDGFWCSWGAWPLTSGREYRWKARTYDGQSWGPYGALSHFFYEPSQPAPTLSAPGSGAEISDLTPTLVCSHNFLGDSTMSHGQAQVREAGGSTIWSSGTYGDGGSLSQAAVPGGILDWGNDYQYRMRVRTSLGTWSPWSGWRSFSTQGAGSPHAVEPSGVKIVANGTLDLYFEAAAGDTITDWTAELWDANGTTLLDSFGPSTAGIAPDGLSVTVNTASLQPLDAGGDYMVRVMYSDEVSAPSPWSSKQPFSINAVPSAPTLVSPSQGAVIQTLTPTLEWAFNDPDEDEWGDAQTAYSIEVRDNATDTLIDTLIGTTAESRAYDGVALSYETTYKWRVLTEDEEGVASAQSSYSTFTPSEPPTASTVQVAAADLDAEGEIDGPTPTVEWTYASPGSKAQDSFRVVAVRVLDEGTVFDSGWVSGADASFALPIGHLADAETYRFDVSVRDTDLLEGTGSTANTLTDFAPPAEIEGIVTVADSDASKITVEWEAPASDPEFDHIEVWRRLYGTDDWRVLSDTIGEGVTAYDDYTAALNKTYEYAVLQVHTVGTGFVQGGISPVTTALSGVPQWYLVAEGRDDLTVALEWFEGGGDKVPVQQETIEALGRPFKVVVEGRVLGSEGEVAVRIDGTEYEQVNAIEALLRARLHRVLVKSPTGEVYPSKMGTITRRRLRHGAVGLTFPYTQIEEA